MKTTHTNILVSGWGSLADEIKAYRVVNSDVSPEQNRRLWNINLKPFISLWTKKEQEEIRLKKKKKLVMLNRLHFHAVRRINHRVCNTENNQHDA